MSVYYLRGQEVGGLGVLGCWGVGCWVLGCWGVGVLGVGGGWLGKVLKSGRLYANLETLGYIMVV